MSAANNPFVKRRLESMYAIEREIIRLYAEACYSNIQGAYGNRSSVSRADELNRALAHAAERLKTLKADLRRIGVPLEAMLSLDDLQRIDLFEAQFKRHDGVFPRGSVTLGLEELSALLADNEITG